MTNPRNHKFQSLVLKTFKIYCFKKKIEIENLRLHDVT